MLADATGDRVPTVSAQDGIVASPWIDHVVIASRHCRVA